MRNQASDDDHEWHYPARRLAQTDLVDPALKLDLKINGKNGFWYWGLHHFSASLSPEAEEGQKWKAPENTLNHLISILVSMFASYLKLTQL
jgi:hypothetical protein